MNSVFETRVDYVDYEMNYAAVSLLFSGFVIHSTRSIVSDPDDVENLEEKLMEEVAGLLQTLIKNQKLEHIE